MSAAAHFKWRSVFKELRPEEQREWLRETYIEHAYYAEMNDMPPLPIAFDATEENGARDDARRHKALPIRDERGRFDRHMKTTGQPPLPEAWKLWLTHVEDGTCRICGGIRAGKLFCKLHARYE